MNENTNTNRNQNANTNTNSDLNQAQPLYSIYPTEACPNIIEPNFNPHTGIVTRFSINSENNSGVTSGSGTGTTRNPFRGESRLRSDSVVKIKTPLLELIRAIAFRPEHVNATVDTEFTVLEIHNSYMKYVSDYINSLDEQLQNRHVIPCDNILRNRLKDRSRCTVGSGFQSL